MKIINCKSCKKKFQYEKRPKLYCSDKCKVENNLKFVICKLCKKEFFHKNPLKQFCSDVCVQRNKSIFQKFYKNTEEGKKKNSEAQKIAQNKPEVKFKKSNISKEISNRPEVKEKFSKWSKEYHNREDVKHSTSNWTKKYFQENPESRFKISESIKQYYKNVYPYDKKAKKIKSNSSKESNNRNEVKEMKSKAMKEYWSNEGKREKQRIKQKNIHSTPEMIELHRKNSQRLWEDSKYANKVFCGMKYKEFIFPSGKIVKTQGYENIVLDELINQYEESDIFVGPIEIRNQIGKIKYKFDNKLRSYYPDIYIKSINMIIEVKSEYTYNQHLECNLAKQDACLEMGLNFKFEIK
jgi:hypothetical protein